MAGTSVNSLKSVTNTRVDVGQAQQLYSLTRALGDPRLCPATARKVDVDEFGRPLGGSGYRLYATNDSACSGFARPMQQRLRHENAERPNLGPCLQGERGGGDFMGYSRDRTTYGIYSPGDTRGAFVKMPPVATASTTQYQQGMYDQPWRNYDNLTTQSTQRTRLQ